jgi:hypothetical protein
MVLVSHLIRYNILINPTGKPGKFRAVDWCVELHNYYIKVKYGGQGSNRSVKRMISESALVTTYSQAHETIEKTMHLNRLTTGHADPDMRKTFTELRNSLSQCSPHEFTPGRRTKYSIPDMLRKGADLLCKKASGITEGEVGIGTEGADEIQPEFEDIIADLS